MKRVIVPLADGFEELEAVAVIDLLRRAGADVTVAGVGATRVSGSHGIQIACDTVIERCDFATADAVVLPGGLPGAHNLEACQPLRAGLVEVSGRGGIVAAICAAPTILNNCGLLDGRRATSHPNHEPEMDRCRYSTERVVLDGNIVTSRGAGTAVEFGGELIRLLAGRDTAEAILAAILHQ